MIVFVPSFASAIYDPNATTNPNGEGVAPMLLTATEVTPTLISTPPINFALYTDPNTEEDYQINSPYDALMAMQKYGLGITDKDYQNFTKNIPKKLDGRILLNVDDSGKAYLVDSDNNKLIYLAKPEQAFNELQKYYSNKLSKAGVEIYDISSELADCTGVAPMKCMIVNGKYFYDQIKGFDFVAGYTYKLEVKKSERTEVIPADASSYSYELIKIISQNPDIPENCSSWFDGCNTCMTNEGELGGCTKKMCFTYETPKCLAFTK